MVTGLELMALNWWLLVAVCGRQTLVCLTLPLLHIHTLLTPGPVYFDQYYMYSE